MSGCYLYVFEMMGYGPSSSYPIKVGITKSITRREAQLRYAYGGLFPKLAACVHFPCRQQAYRAEQMILAAFPKSRPPIKELLRTSADEVLRFIRTQEYAAKLEERTDGQD